MKLYYGGFGDYMEFTVAENEADAIRNVGIKINAPFLPIAVTEIAEVDGHKIQISNCEAEPEIIKDFSNDAYVKAFFEAGEVKADEVVKTYHCKQAGCDFSAHSLNELSQHGRKEHPKGD